MTDAQAENLDSNSLGKSDAPNSEMVDSKSAWPAIAFVSVLIVAYGFEVFSFHPTVDEELFGENIRGVADWIAEGRWAMAILFVLSPIVVTPVVTSALGIAMSGAGWWLLSRRVFSMTPWQAAFIAALAGTIPVLAFTFSFSTIAHGIGVGNLLLFVFARYADSPSWRYRALAVTAAAAAIGIYDPFAIALAVLVVYRLIIRPRLPNVVLSIGALFIAFVTSRLLGALAQYVSGVPQGEYVGQYVDIAGLFDNPIDRVSVAAVNVVKTLGLSAELFGAHSAWLLVTMTLLAGLALLGIWSLGGGSIERAVRYAAFAALLLVPVLAEAISPTPLQLRSMIYLPLLILCLGAFAVLATRRMRLDMRRASNGIVAAAIVLALLGSMSISNRLFGSSETAFALDQNLAFQIGFEKDSLLPGENNTSTAIVVSGKHSWPQSYIKVNRETLGASFFGWSGGTQRVAAFLSSQGVRTHKATWAQEQAAWPELDQMPAYPQPGWVQTFDGVLLVKFGERTADQ